MAEFEHRVLISPAFDKRSDDPHKNYGIGNMKMTFLVIGPKGAVQWMIGTDWHVRSARDHLAGFDPSRFARPHEPQGYDLGYHSPQPQYEGHHGPRECEFVEGGQCYYDGSSLNAELLTERFLAEGEAYLWPALEAYYRCRFEDGPWPFDAEAVEAKAQGRYV